MISLGAFDCIFLLLFGWALVGSESVIFTWITGLGSLVCFAVYFWDQRRG